MHKSIASAYANITRINLKAFAWGDSSYEKDAAEADAMLARRAPTAPPEMIRKTYVQPTPPPAPQPTEDNWEKFAGIIGAEVGLIERRLTDEIKKLREQVDELTSEITLLRSISKGGVTPMRGRKNVA